MEETVEDLCAELYEAKRVEDAAKKRRVKAELALAELLDCETGKSKTHTLEGWKATVKRPTSYKLDEAAWSAIAEDIPADRVPVKTRLSADARGCKWLAEHDPEVWAKCAQAIELREGKPAVTVTRIETEEE